MNVSYALTVILDLPNSQAGRCTHRSIKYDLSPLGWEKLACWLRQRPDSGFGRSIGTAQSCIWKNTWYLENQRASFFFLTFLASQGRGTWTYKGLFVNISTCPCSHQWFDLHGFALSWLWLQLDSTETFLWHWCWKRVPILPWWLHHHDHDQLP